MSAQYELSGEELACGQDAYLYYLGGLAILHSPYGGYSRSTFGDNLPENPAGFMEYREPVVAHAEELMVEGLFRVIAVSNRLEPGQAIGAAEGSYKTASPNFLRIVNTTCESLKGRVEAIDLDLALPRPMPLRKYRTYTYLCHSRKSEIYTKKLLDNILPSELFGTVLDGRTVQCVQHRSD